ncbi:hypothetical protein BDN72DRAFT_782421 [Pluteus cervinus]|uniref:Uncharacterized protein n=1 Tax=Pluteus cervinus TaxID=181527 RepID=A0ACD2ZXD2_9AGAR|nr:hypothetical protein BDN72DRAFT_782421 [Pluteus cervinus]
MWSHLYHVRCFLHVVSLVSKSVLNPFDAKKKKGIENGEAGGADDDVGVQELVNELNKAKEDWEDDQDDEDVATAPVDKPLDDNVDGWVDELEELEPEEIANLNAYKAPVKKFLCKVRTLSYKVINSTTKLLPLWYAALEKHGLEAVLLPRDVSTRWNSTCGLLEVACENKQAVDEITKEKELRALELSEEEWELAEQLRDVLKVS